MYNHFQKKIKKIKVNNVFLRLSLKSGKQAEPPKTDTYHVM